MRCVGCDLFDPRIGGELRTCIESIDEETAKLREVEDGRGIGCCDIPFFWFVCIMPVMRVILKIYERRL